MNASKARGLIILLSILALAASLGIENKLVALILMSVCILSAALILYRHLGELTELVVNFSQGINPGLSSKTL